MEPLPRKKKDWVLTDQSLRRLLSVLDEDPERAGEQYEILRRKLVRFFEWRGSATPEELTDETLNRLARKIDEGEAIRNLSDYVGGMARFVWLEALKEQERARGAFEELRAESQYSSPVDSSRVECFEFCLEGLLSESRTLILDYYRAERSDKIKLRRQLAEKLGIPLNALRIRAHRIRLQLEKCVGDCLKKSEEG
jgi:DNA-directed RNA polymerase specialized sigma24 family protein